MGLLAETLTLSTGESMTLRQLFQGRQQVLVFVRHLGCTFCREHVRELSQLPKEQVTFVTTADNETTRRFQSWVGTPHRFVCDESASLFQRFGLKRASFSQAISPKILGRGLVSLVRGNINGRPAGDPLRLGGTFVFDADGLLTWSHVARDVSDNASLERIKQALADGHQVPSSKL